MDCIYCRREIREGEPRYYSHQAGMKGYYHWECFIEACRHANQVGAQEIENATVHDNAYDVYNSYESHGC